MKYREVHVFLCLLIFALLVHVNRLIGCFKQKNYVFKSLDVNSIFIHDLVQPCSPSSAYIPPLVYHTLHLLSLLPSLFYSRIFRFGLISPISHVALPLSLCFLSLLFLRHLSLHPIWRIVQQQHLRRQPISREPQRWGTRQATIHPH